MKILTSILLCSYLCYACVFLDFSQNEDLEKSLL